MYSWKEFNQEYADIIELTIKPISKLRALVARLLEATVSMPAIRKVSKCAVKSQTPRNTVEIMAIRLKELLQQFQELRFLGIEGTVNAKSIETRHGMAGLRYQIDLRDRSLRNCKMTVPKFCGSRTLN